MTDRIKSNQSYNAYYSLYRISANNCNHCLGRKRIIIIIIYDHHTHQSACLDILGRKKSYPSPGRIVHMLRSKGSTYKRKNPQVISVKHTLHSFFLLIKYDALRYLSGCGQPLRDNLQYSIEHCTNILFRKKRSKKCSTLNSCFSTDFHRKIVKFCTKLS